MRARSEEALAQARVLIDRCASRHERHIRERQRYEAVVAHMAELRDDMRGLVTVYSRDLRQLDVAPESAVILVKELVNDPARRLPADLLLQLRQDVVGWAVEAYYAA